MVVSRTSRSDGQSCPRALASVGGILQFASTIVLDLMRPGVTGEEFANGYRARCTANAPIAAVSGAMTRRPSANASVRARSCPSLDISEFVARLKATIRADRDGAPA